MMVVITGTAQGVTHASNYLIYLLIHFCFFSADIISCVEFNHDGDLLATGDKGGRVVIFQRDPSVSFHWSGFHLVISNRK